MEAGRTIRTAHKYFTDFIPFKTRVLLLFFCQGHRLNSIRSTLACLAGGLFWCVFSFVVRKARGTAAWKKRGWPRSKQWCREQREKQFALERGRPYKYEPNTKNTPKKPPATKATSTPVGTARISSAFSQLRVLLTGKTTATLNNSKLKYENQSDNRNT